MVAACYLALTFIPVTELFMVRIFFTLVISFSGLSAVGSVKGARLVKMILIEKHCN